MKTASRIKRVSDLTHYEKVWSIEHRRREGIVSLIDVYVLRCIEVIKDGNDCYVDSATRERYHIHQPQSLGLFVSAGSGYSKTLVTPDELNLFIRKTIVAGEYVYTSQASNDFGKNVGIKAIKLENGEVTGQLFYKHGAELSYSVRLQFDEELQALAEENK